MRGPNLQLFILLLLLLGEGAFIYWYFFLLGTEEIARRELFG
jgi:hypothetical protein